jgi:SCO1/SenC
MTAIDASITPRYGSTTPPKSARRMLLLLAAVFFLPFIVGTGLFWSGWRPEKFANHGQLLQPPLVLPESGLRDTEGNALPTSRLLGKWLLVKLGHEPCRAACDDELQQMQQVHVALNKEQSRVQRVFIAGDGVSSLAELHGRFPDLQLASLDSTSAGENWPRVFAGAGRELYLVDPLGNVIMRYDDPPDMRGVLKDLERLLKYSWIR